MSEHKRDFTGRSQLAPEDAKQSTYRPPIGFRNGVPFYTKAELEAYDAEHNQHQGHDND